MDIDLIYSKRDPKHLKTRDFILKFVRERGLCARINEIDSTVPSPRLVINGQELSDRRTKSRTDTKRSYPSLDDIARTLEQHFWSL